MNRFQPTLQQVRDPEQLLKLIRDLTTAMLTMEQTVKGLTSELNSTQSRMTAQLARERGVLSGVPNGAGALVKLGIDNNATVPSNLSATTAPTATDDETKGWQRGSKWIDTTGPNVYFAAKVQAGSAVWKLV